MISKASFLHAAVTYLSGEFAQMGQRMASRLRENPLADYFHQGHAAPVQAHVNFARIHVAREWISASSSI
jgi:hypothetical protein